MQRLNIEKVLNREGYYRILPLESFEEFLSVIRHTTVTFDFLIANKLLIDSIATNEYNLLRYSPMIINTLIYDDCALNRPEVIDAPTPRIIRKLSTPLNDQSIRDFLDLTALLK